jgi:hypothetical protein
VRRNLRLVVTINTSKTEGPLPTYDSLAEYVEAKLDGLDV